MRASSDELDRTRGVIGPESGPSLRAIPIGAATAHVAQLLSSRQQLQLKRIATELRLPAKTILYREDSVAGCVFIVARGTVKVFRDLPSGRRRVMAFLFHDDVFGLAEAGRYVHTAQAVTGVKLHRISADALIEILRRDPELEFQFLCKVTHDLRAIFRQMMVISRRDAVGRVAMFLRMLQRPGRPARHAAHIDIPMSRSDTANYLGLTLETVCRACRTLERSGIVTFDGRHAARIVDSSRFEKLVSAL